VAVFEKKPIQWVFSETEDTFREGPLCNHLSLFDL
jgi:hypothetical protein